MSRPLRFYAAGSLRRAFTPLLAAFSERYAVTVEPTFGPAGLLFERLVQGAEADIFASANCAHPQRLKTLGLAENTAAFAVNGLCVVMRNIPALTSQPWLAALLDPRFALSTSTPGCDPGGDYAFQLFDKIESLHRGWGKRLREKAKPLVGGSMAHNIPSGMTAGSHLTRSGQSDMHISYASYLPLLTNQPDLRVMPIPEPYAVKAEYMLATLRPVRDEALRLSDYILSSSGQRFLVENGFTSIF